MTRCAAAPAALLAGARQQAARQALVGIEVAVGRGLEPVDEVRHLVLLGLLHRPKARREEVGERAQAEVVAAPLQERDLEVRRVVAEDGERLGDVGLDELALQVARRGGNDDGRIVRPRPEDRGDQVGERLADARARLHHQVFAVVVGADDGLEHVELAGALLVAGHRAERAAALEVAHRRLHVDLRAVFVRRQMAFPGGFRRFRQEVRPVGIVDKRRRGHGR